MLDVFISYSRQNLSFVNQLATALIETGKTIWFDQVKEPLQGIPAGSKWWDEIKHGIETADNFLFILSPQSIASPYCQAEVAHALKHDKRIVVVLYCGTETQFHTFQAIDTAIDAISSETELPVTVSADILQVRALARRNWLNISAIQYVPFESGYAWEVSVKQLTEALDLDLQWLRLWGQFRQAVQIWQESNFDADFLWGEKRRQVMRASIIKRKQSLNMDEQEFLRSEQEHLLKELENIDTSHIRRLVISERLADLGDTRLGVGLGEDGLPQIDWCYMKGGETILTMEQNILGGGRETVEYFFTIAPFYIAKYLVTYVQYQAFIDAGDGWMNDEWWQGLKKHEIGMARTAFKNSPRDTVSWYQAMAFCRWLNARVPLQNRPNLPKAEIRLPTEWEWQWAACGGDIHREYPWIGGWDGRYANTKEAALGRSTAVGVYPFGYAECGALDMAGNLWEWSLNDYENITQIGFQSNNCKVLRGGAWQYNSSSARVMFRDTNEPYRIGNRHGFRIVYAPSVALSSE